MATFITGITGLLGSALVEENRKKDHAIIGLYKGAYEMADTEYVKYVKADVCDRSALFKAASKCDIDCVIHTAGIADTDICEDEEYYKVAYDSNVKGTQNAIEIADKKSARIVYISTNAIFDGERPPYSEESKPHPINKYGAIKLECEKIVKDNTKESLIIRPILMYGLNNPHERKSFFMKILEKLQKGERVNIVNDVFENPLLSYHCARMIWRLIDKGATGTYHLAGRDVLSRYEAARIIAEVFSIDSSLLNPVPSSYFKKIAPRPKNTSYKTTKVEKELGERSLGFDEGLVILKKRLSAEAKILHERI